MLSGCLVTCLVRSLFMIAHVTAAGPRHCVAKYLRASRGEICATSSSFLVLIGLPDTPAHQYIAYTWPRHLKDCIEYCIQYSLLDASLGSCVCDVLMRARACAWFVLSRLLPVAHTSRVTLLAIIPFNKPFHSPNKPIYPGPRHVDFATPSAQTWRRQARRSVLSTHVLAR